jgi:hypothetical protein
MTVVRRRELVLEEIQACREINSSINLMLKILSQYLLQGAFFKKRSNFSCRDFELDPTNILTILSILCITYIL